MGLPITQSEKEVSAEVPNSYQNYIQTKFGLVLRLMDLIADRAAKDTISHVKWHGKDKLIQGKHMNH